jgi:thioredoxin 1
MIHSPHVAPVNELNFDAEVRQSPLPVFIDVSTEWCPPCRVAAPIVTELAERLRDRVKFVIIDGDESPELVANLGVRGFPTFLGLVGGEVVSRRAGFGGKAPLEAMANELMASAH